MAVFLVGGGWSAEHAPAMFGGFLEAARVRAGGGVPRVLLVVLGTDPESRSYHQRYLDALAPLAPHELVLERVALGVRFDPQLLEGVHGLLVGGGPTPEYHASLAPSYAEVRELVAGGLPYAGFSAGAAIAATDAVVGGWRLDGVAVCPEESNEDLDELTVVAGIGLVEGTVDVHAAQWGNLSRLVAVVGAGLAPSGLAVDECTTLEVGSGSVTGAGCVWWARGSADGVVVRRQRP